MAGAGGMFHTARELADLALEAGIAGFPVTERGVRALAEREAWGEMGPQLARLRPTTEAGGRPSWEYHVSLLPERLQAAAAAGMHRRSAVAALAREAEIDRRRIAALKKAALPAGAQAVMDARAEILLSIEGYAIAQGQTRAWAIARFLEAQEDHAARQDIERRRDAGQFLTEREAASLGRRLILTAADGFHLDPARLAKANDRRDEAAIRRSAIYDWFKARDEQGVTALAPETTKAEQPIPAAFHDFLKFYARPAKPTIADAHRQWLEAVEASARVERMPLTLAQVTRILRKRLNSIERNVGREGLLTLRSRMAYVTRTTEDMWPTTIYTADGKTFDAEVADPVSGRPMRPEITSVLDVATRKCVGYAVSRKENVIAVSEALRRSCSTHGICAIFYTDRGSGYKNKTFDDDQFGGLMGRLGITKMHALPYNSQAKGIIERFNHVWNDLAKRLPTYIGRDMDKEAKQEVHRETRREIALFGTARRLPSWADFLAAVEKTIAEYNDRPHDGLPLFEDPATGKRRHMTPSEAWEMHVQTGFQPVTIDPEDLDDLFRPHEIRTVRRGLVEWNTNAYSHTALEAYHGEKVAVGYDLHQADKVWVREFDVAEGQPGRLICVAVFGGNEKRYVPLSFEQKAVEDRSRAALKRMDRKRRDKEAELGGPALLDAQPDRVADFIDLSPRSGPHPVPAAAVIGDAAPETATRRRVFASDEELAAWALAHPGEVTARQAELLRECLARPAARDFFRMSGIDVEALRTLLRAAA